MRDIILVVAGFVYAVSASWPGVSSGNIQVKAAPHWNVVHQQIRVDPDVPRDIDGLTPLTRAAQRGNMKEVRRLVKLGADVNATDQNLHTVLAWCKEPRIVRYL